MLYAGFMQSAISFCPPWSHHARHGVTLGIYRLICKGFSPPAYLFCKKISNFAAIKSGYMEFREMRPGDVESLKC